MSTTTETTFMGHPLVLVRPRSSVFLMIGCLPPSMTV
jgi:hypothetical protein